MTFIIIKYKKETIDTSCKILEMELFTYVQTEFISLSGRRIPKSFTYVQTEFISLSGRYLYQGEEFQKY